MLAVWVHEVRPCLPQWMHDVLDKSHLGSVWYLVMVQVRGVEYFIYHTEWSKNNPAKFREWDEDFSVTGRMAVCLARQDKMAPNSNWQEFLYTTL